MMDSAYCTLYLVRHGETEWNVEDIVLGQSDSSLTQEGIRETEALAQALQGVAFDAIFSSDLGRAYQTAEILGKGRGLTVETSPLLRERNYGRFHGVSWKELKAELKEKLEERRKLPDAEFLSFTLDPDIESESAVASRFISKLKDIAATHPSKTVLVVTHGGCVRAFLATVGYASIKRMPPGSLVNSGHVTVLSDGKDFIIKEVVGLHLEPA